ncbi:calcium-binding protein [Erythrobacter sp.]|uniref:calcium-binding protein n=1 Tax=Erythrobacter sp. TaxID=1042 RepID=UPI003C764176
MSDGQGSRIKPREYASSALLTSLAYHSADLTPDLSKQQLREAMKSNLDIREAFQAQHNSPASETAIDAQIDQFTDRYEIVGSVAGYNNVGANAIVFADTGLETLTFAIAGVEPRADIERTIFQTRHFGYNLESFHGVNQLYHAVFSSSSYDGWRTDIFGHSLGGQTAQVLAAQFIFDRRTDQLGTLATFGTFGLKFTAAGADSTGHNLKLLSLLKDDSYVGPGWVHFANQSDTIPEQLSSLVPGSSVVDGFVNLQDSFYTRSLTLGEALLTGVHGINAYANTLVAETNNESSDSIFAVPFSEADLNGLGLQIGLPFGLLANLGTDATRPLEDDIARLRYYLPPQVDPVSGAVLPEGIVRRGGIHIGFGQFAGGDIVDTVGRAVELDVVIVDGMPTVAASRALGGISDDGSARVSVEKVYENGRAVSTEINLEDNPLPFELSDVGGYLGTQLGYRIAGGNEFVGIGTSALLQTLGDNLGDTLDGIIGNQSVEQASSDAFGTFDTEFTSNLKSSGIGAVSSFLAAELVNLLGISGFAEEALNTGANTVIGQIASQIANGERLADIAAGLDSAQSLATLGSAFGSFVGTKLASEVLSFDTIGGQIGSAVGSSLGVLAATSAVVGTGSSATLLGVQLGAFAGPVGAAIGAFVGFLAGGLIGSVFGGTPRSGADATWDGTTGRFVADNVYSRKGGSKETAEAMASVVAETFNSVLESTGGRLADPSAITAGNYGMRKSDFVYRPTSTRDKDAITYRVSSKNNDDAFSDLTGYGIWKGLTDPDFQIIGGSNYVKRAVYATFEMGGMSATDFDQSVLLGNIASAQSYEAYLANSAVINAIVSGEPDSVFAAETALNLVRAQELGLHKRHRSDWFGGYNALLDEAGTNVANVEFGFDYDPFSDQASRLIGVGEFVMGDSIDVAGQTTIERPDGENSAQNIDLSSGRLSSQEGYVVNGMLRDDIAKTGSDFAQVSSGSGSVAGSQLRTTATVSVSSVTSSESDEQFRVVLFDGAGTYLQHAEATVTIVDGSDKPHVMVGRSFANEGDDLIWRVSLSKAASQNVTLDLDLTSDGAEAGSDFIDALEVSATGTGAWTSASTIMLASGVEEYFVRVRTPAAVSDVEGHERLVLSTSASTGASALENGAQTVSGVGTIVDGSNDDPLVWADDLIVHENTTGQVSVARSRTDSVASQFGYETVENKRLDIAVAATVDAGAGNDTVRASDLGDNIFGGDGNDTLYGGRLDDWLLGGEGDDRLYAGGSSNGDLGGDGNYLDGGAGNDELFGYEGSDWLEGGDGVDDLSGGGGDDILTGGADDGDDLFGGTGDDTYLLRRGDGADTVTELNPTSVAQDAHLVWDSANDPYLNQFSVTVRGEIADLWANNSDLNSGAYGAFVAAQYAGENAQDWFGYFTPGVSNRSVGGGNDSVVLGQGIGIGDIQLRRSSLSDGTPTDHLIIEVMQADGVSTGDSLTLQNWFSNPFDRIEWLKFADGNEIRIGDLTSFVIGTNGDDTLIGTEGNDFVYGGGGDDTLFLLAGDDIGNGGSGADFVSGDAGKDLIVGGSGIDFISGEAGDDTLSGDGGDDRVYGGDGHDLISGGRGNDVLVGGKGNDVFKYHRGDGRDAIVDKMAGLWTTIWTAATGWDPNYTEGSDGTLTGPGGAILRENIGSDEYPEIRWNGRFEHDSVNGALRYFEPAGSGPAVVDEGTDTIEFDPTIHIQDIVLERRQNDGSASSPDDLVLHISSDGGASGTFGGTDRIALTDWYGTPGAIEKLAFYSTGTLDLTQTNIRAGTDGDDSLSGGSGANWITGGTGDDTIFGNSAHDILSGNGGADRITAYGGDDVLYGGGGNDVLIGGAGADLLVGGAGSDWASYEDQTSGIELSLANVEAATGAAQGDSFSSIENLRGGSGVDLLGGDAGENILEGGGGDDTLFGGAGDDTYIWNGSGDGEDVIKEGTVELQVAMNADGTLGAGFVGDWYVVGSDMVWLQPGEPEPANVWAYQIRPINSSTVAFQHHETVTRIEGHPKPTGSKSTYPSGWKNGFVQETAGGLATREIIGTSADSGDDTLELGAGLSLADLIFSETGNNLELGIAGGGSSVLIRNQSTVGGRVEYLQLHDGLVARLDNLKLSVNGDGADNLVVGDANGNILSGLDGDDVVFGGAGNDVLSGNAGDDIVEGGAGADDLYGSSNSSAADNPTGWGDTVRYVSSPGRVQIDLTQTYQSDGDAEGDRLYGFEHIEGSWSGNDVLLGDDNDNRIFGHGGDDVLNGHGGNDVLVGGEGDDHIVGGTGEDNLSGGVGNDFLDGYKEDDLIDGGGGRDKMLGGDGNDTLIGGEGDDGVNSVSSDHGMWGGAGDDTLDGGAGNDDLFGEADNDTLIGGVGNDDLDGGWGDDVFVFGANDGSDTIVDTAGVNSIALVDGVTRDRVWLSQSGNDLRIQIIGGDTDIAVRDFFASSGETVMERIQTADGALSLNDPVVISTTDANSLINMMATQSSSVPEAMPEQLNTAIDRAWFDGSTPAPRAPETPHRVQIETLSANAFNLDQWPDFPPSGKGFESLVNDEIWPGHDSANPSDGQLGEGWYDWYVHETEWDFGTGPYGQDVVSMLSGQTNTGSSGGGAHSHAFTIDKTKTYEFSMYLSADQLDKHLIYVGLTGDVTNGSSGTTISYPYFSQGYASASTDMEAKAWYKLVAYVLPDGSPLESSAAYGGIYDTRTGEKVRDVAHFIWDGSKSSNEAYFRFFNSGGTEHQDKFTRFFKPEVREVTDERYMMREGEELNVWQDSKLTNPAYVEGFFKASLYDSDGEARWSEVQGPDGSSQVVLEAGQFNSSSSGGGAYTNTLKADPDKTYRYVQYFRKSDLTKHDLYAGIYANGDSGDGKIRLSDGQPHANDYFANFDPTWAQSNLVEDEWYMVVGYVFDKDTTVGSHGNAGGIFRVSDQTKIADVKNYKWAENVGEISAFGRYFTSGDSNLKGWSTQFAEPSFGAIDESELATYEADPFGLSNTWLGEEVTIEASAGVTDFDDGTAALTWALDPDGAPAKGKIVAFDENTGSVTYRPYAEALGADTFSVVAIDPDGNQTRIPIEVELTLGNVNTAPLVPSEGYAIEFAEDSAIGDLVGALAATDSDGAVEYLFDESLMVSFNQAHWTFSSDRRFKMNRATGEIFINDGVYDFESGPTEFSYNVRIRDRSGSTDSRSAYTSVTLSVGDMNEAHIMAAATIDVAYFDKALGPFIPVPDIQGRAINLVDMMLDDPEGRTLSWSLDSPVGSPWALSVDGTLHQVGSVNPDQPYSLTVKTTDETGRERTAVLTVDVGAVGSADDIPASSPPSNYPSNDEYPPYWDPNDPNFHIPPVILDLDGDGVELLSISADVRFDMDANGTLDRTGWFSSDDAVLAYDENGNGLVDNGSEINFQRFLEGAFSDLEGLAFFDTDADGLFDSGDAQWSEFLVWQDANTDGISQASELRSLDDLGIVSIDLSGQHTGQLPDGSQNNVLYATSSFSRADGTSGTVGDVFFVFDPDTPAEAPPTVPSNPEPDTQPGTGEPTSGDTPSIEDLALDFGSLSYGSKSKRYRLYSNGGSLKIGPKGSTHIVDARAGQTAGPMYFAFSNRTFGMLSAVVLDLDNDGLETRRYRKTRAAFDMDGNGTLDNTGWTTSNDGFLVIDRNQNGRIDDAREMSFLDAEGHLRTGQDGLLALDSNADGVVSADDELFADLKIWVDSNRNGTTDLGEMQSLAERGIESIALAFAPLNERKRFGRNLTLATTVFTRSDGSTGTAGDIAFGFRPGDEPVANPPSVAASTGLAIEDGLAKLADLPFQDMSIEELIAHWPDQAIYNNRLDTYIGKFGGEFALPVSAVEAENDRADKGLPEQGNAEPAHIAPDAGLDATLAARIALMRQDLAAFGGTHGIDDLGDRRGGVQTPLDYFA